MKKPENINKLFNDCRVDVTERIKEGSTLFVLTRKDAELLTKLRGYFYELFDSERNLVGFGIPK